MAILKVANIHFDVAGTTRLQANGANVLTIVTGNTEDARFDAAGNLLIGRTNSTIGQGVKLDVNGAVNASAIFSSGTNLITYTNSVGTAGNNYTNAVGTAGNNYTVAVGAASNTITIAAFAKANSTSYTSNLVISVADNTNAALRITQTGTGEAIRVEDSANPDSTPFVVDASGRVGIGTTSLDEPLIVTGAIVSSGATAANKTSAAAFDFSPFGSFNSARILAWGPVGTTANISFWSGSGGLGATERVRIDSTGNVLIGRTDSTVGLGVKLDVAGAINTSALYVNGATVTGGGAAVFSANVGNNSANTFSISHNLNKNFVVPAVRENSTGYYVYPDMKHTSANTIVLEFVTAPTTNQYTVIVLG